MVATPKGKVSNVRGGLDFHVLSRGSERSYSTGYLVNLDQDTMGLCAGTVKESVFNMSKNILIAHTKRVLDQIETNSNRIIQQFCFGTTYVQVNPNFRKLDRMDPLTWKKEGIATAWAGVRGLRRICCKHCCLERTCPVRKRSFYLNNT